MEQDQERSEHKGEWKLWDLIYEQQLHHEGRDSRELCQGIQGREQEHRACQVAISELLQPGNFGSNRHIQAGERRDTKEKCNLIGGTGSDKEITRLSRL